MTSLGGPKNAHLLTVSYLNMASYILGTLNRFPCDSSSEMFCHWESKKRCTFKSVFYLFISQVFAFD